MVADFHDRTQIELFLRTANAEELLAERTHIQSLLAETPNRTGDVEHLAARIAYELRFRIPQAI